MEKTCSIEPMGFNIVSNIEFEYDSTSDIFLRPHRYDLSVRFIDLGVNPANVAEVSKRLLVQHLPRLRGLDTRDGAQELMAILDSYKITAGDFLVLDSTQRVTEGEENSNDTMRKVYNLTSAELKRREITVLRTDNTGWDTSRERGASAKRDDVGYSWLLEREGTSHDVLKLTRSKHRGKSGGDRDALILRREVVNGTLRFTPTKSTFGDQMAEARALLDRLEVPYEAGQGKAWKLVEKAREAGKGFLPASHVN